MRYFRINLSASQASFSDNPKPLKLASDIAANPQVAKRSRFKAFSTAVFLFLSIFIANNAYAAPPVVPPLVDQISASGTICGGDLVKYGNCTAGEISLASISNVTFAPPHDVSNTCILGETITASTATITYDINTQKRYDLLLWIGEQQGVDPRDVVAGDPAKSCFVASLPGPFAIGGVFDELEGKAADQCGDINGSVAAAQESRDFTNLSFECQDNNNDGTADIQILLSWSQNVNQSCGTGPGESFPTAGAGSKCDYQLRESILTIIQPASLTIVKNTTGGDGIFDFTLNNGFAGTQITTSGGTNSFTYNTLAPTSGLNIVELVPAGWDATDISCTGATNNGSFVDDPDTPAITGIVIAEGEDVVCTVSNTKLAKLTIIKNAAGGNGVFNFSGSVGGFSIDTTTLNTGQTLFSNLSPGTYSVAESITDANTAGFDFSNASCSNGSGIVDLSDPTLANMTGINLAAGEDVVCTFNNVIQGASSFTKLTIGGDGSFGFTSNLPNLPSGDGSFSLSTSTGSSAPLSGTGLVTGTTYTITETAQANWTLTDISCSGASDWAFDIPSRNVSFTPVSGETINCNFTNIKDGTLIVEKQTLPNGDPTSFEFTGNLVGNISDGQQLTVSGQITIPVGSEEVVPAGWELSNISCTGGTGASTILVGTNGLPDFNPGDTSILVLPAAGETITCVFTNTKQGQITVVKHITATGPAVQDFDFTSNLPGSGNDIFTLSPVDEATDAQLVVPGLKPGIYAVGENPPTEDGWALIGATCDDGSKVTDINLAPGENIICTFTNAPLGSTTIIKNSLGGNGQFDFHWSTTNNPSIPEGENADFPLITSAGIATRDFSNKLLINNPYDLTEINIPPPVGSYLKNWNLTNTDCMDATKDSIFNPGENGADATIFADSLETVFCTFTNTLDGTLVIRKQTIPDKSLVDFEFTSSTPNLNGPLQDYDINGNELSHTDQPGLFGTEETVPAGWALNDISCTGATSSAVSIGGTPAFVAGDKDVSVNIAAGETVTCTYTNTKQGSLTIIKNTVGGDGVFSFNHTVPAVTTPFAIDTAVNNTHLISSTLLPGNYIASEVVPSGWALTNITCTGATDSTIMIGASGGFNPGDNAVTVDLLSGEDIICTFTNTKDNPSLEIVKFLTGNADEDGSGTISLNDTLTYTLTVTNIGNVTLSNVTVSDTLIMPNSNTCATVAIGATCLLTGTYQVKQADVDTPHMISNTGTGDSSETAPVAVTLITLVEPEDPALNTTKELTSNADEDGSGSISLNDTLTYTVTVTNTSNVTLNEVTVTDDKITPNEHTCTQVAIGASCVLIGTYKVTQADIDMGDVRNKGTGISPDPQPAEDNMELQTPITQNSELTTIKVLTSNADEDSSGAISLGDTLTYTVTVTNSGNVTLNKVTVTDTRITPNSTSCTSVAPKATCVLTGTYQVTQADVNVGNIHNTGTGDSDETTAVDAILKTPVTQNPALTTVKELTSNADEDGSGTISLGDTLTYTITVTNTGDVTLNNVSVIDNRTTPNSNTCTPVAIAATCILTGTYRVTQLDVDAGNITNTATGNSKETPPIDDTLITPILSNSAITLSKTTTSTGYSAVGDSIVYNFIVTNTGNITLTGPLSVSDDKIVAPNVVTCPAGDLIPSNTLSCTATYTVTQADLNAGSVTNVASASMDGKTSATDTVTVDSTHSGGGGGGKPTPIPTLSEWTLLLLSMLLALIGWRMYQQNARRKV